MQKYSDLVEQRRARGLKTSCFPLEIGCRGNLGNSSWRALKMLGIVDKGSRTLLKDAGDNAETASVWIWRRWLECSPREIPHGTESTTNLNRGDWNEGEDHPYSLAPTNNKASSRIGGEDHPHSLAARTNHDRMRLVERMEGNVISLWRIKLHLVEDTTC